LTLTNDCCAFLLFFQLYKGYRADSCRQLHADMLSEATNVARARVFTADGDTPLKAAYRDGDAVSATRLHAAGGTPAAECDAAFIVACAHGNGAMLAEAPALCASAGRTWATAWERAADEGAVAEMEADVITALLPGAVELADGLDFCADAAGFTALRRAARGGHVLAVDRLLGAGAAVNLADSSGATPLYMAAFNGHEAVVARLLAAKAAVNLARKNDGVTPLSMAAQKGHEAVVAQLLSAGAAVDLAGSDGATPLYWATQLGHEPVVARLLAAGAVVDLADSNGRTPLFAAAQNGHVAVVAQLLGAGAEVDLAANETDQDDETNAGATPLMKAAQGGNVDVARLLLVAGAEADHMSAMQGFTPRSCATVTGGATHALFNAHPAPRTQ
jgi:ankyrin repeat protein